VPILNPALILAGFVLAHAAWSVFDVRETLVPMAVIEKDGKRTLVRFEADTQAKAIDKGKASMAAATKTADAWALAREDLMPEGGGKIEVFSVTFWSKGMESPAVLIQRFEPLAKNGTFKLIGEPKVVIRGVVQKPEQAKELLRAVRQGVSQHPQAARLWDSWHSR